MMETSARCCVICLEDAPVKRDDTEPDVPKVQ